ncbi:MULTISPECIES: aminoacyl-histidine dipeptidase [Sphingobacterium]|uniref:Aminoacyl-histidine dipeptidase n=1 Tax=Sphingobacterium populi TaxID=1812824 RepID=A0ABW5UAS0_9SPHI|nr:aminoacyl-histidine dipeptidase [Sphingobacterium sp. CFCC 11742]
MSIHTLEPTAIWSHFAAINAIPRASKKEEAIIEFMLSFGKSLQLSAERDEIGNVLIRKAATAGYESKKTVVLQAHLDMVHQKNATTDFDFATSGINMFVDGDWVRAKGTTLGADNGLGVAAIMGILSSTDIPHPEIEALFTIDEETGMTGAKALTPGWLTGKYLLNLDTEEDHEITIGCAGGVDVTATGALSVESTEEYQTLVEISVSGLQGGHSGMDINKGLANANKVLMRVLDTLIREADVRLYAVEGGGLRNAIPREAKATLACRSVDAVAVHDLVKRLGQVIAKDYAHTEPNLVLSTTQTDIQEELSVLTSNSQQEFVAACNAAHHGVFRMSPVFPDLVETSNNVARIVLKQGKYTVLCLTRSAIQSSKDYLAMMLRSTFELIGAEVAFSGDYPGWEPEPDGELVQLTADIYKRLFGEDPLVCAGHGGLECGLIGEAYPDLKMVSIGPTIRGAHSPDERASIPSVAKFWTFFLELLKNTP